MNNSTDIAQAMYNRTEGAIYSILSLVHWSLVEKDSDNWHFVVKTVSNLTGYPQGYTSALFDIIMFEKQDVNNIAR